MLPMIMEHLYEQVNSAMPCGTLRASLPQFLHGGNGAAAPHSLPQNGGWVLTRPGVRSEKRLLPSASCARQRQSM